MDSYRLSADQVRAVAQVTPQEAQAAVYMASAAKGNTLAEYSEKTGIPFGECRQFAFKWGVRFEDFNPTKTPKRLEFRKIKRGQWELYNGDEVIGECSRNADGRYVARTFSQTAVAKWNAQQAMAGLAAELDAQSPDLEGFEGRPLRVLEVGEKGIGREEVFGAITDEVMRCRDALAFNAHAKAAA